MYGQMSIVELQNEQRRIDRDLTDVEDQIQVISKQRSANIASAVEEHLGQLNRNVYRDLMDRFPLFMTFDVSSNFQRHCTWTALFWRRARSIALLQLQTQFRAFLEQSNYFREEQTQVRSLNERQRLLTAELEKVTNALVRKKRVTVIQGTPVALDPAATIAPPMSIGVIAPVPVQRRQHIVRETRVVYDSDYDDDSPLSNILLIDALTQNTPPDPVVGDGGAYEMPAEQSAFSSQDNSIAELVSTAADAVSVSAPDSCSVIDTSDSLGYFS